MAMSDEEASAKLRTMREESEKQLASFLDGLTPWGDSFESFKSLCGRKMWLMAKAGIIKNHTEAGDHAKVLHQNLVKLSDALMGSCEIDFGKVATEIISMKSRAILYQNHMKAALSKNPLVILFACDEEWSNVFVRDATDTVTNIIFSRKHGALRWSGDDNDLCDSIFRATGVYLDKDELWNRDRVISVMDCVHSATAVANAFVSFAIKTGYNSPEHMLYRWKDV